MRKLLLATTAAAFVASAGSAFAESGSDTFNITATAEQAITVSCDATLSFGTFAISSANGAGNVSVAAASGGATSTTASGVVIVSSGSPVACTVAGDDNGDVGTVSINGGNTGVTLTDSVSSDTLSATLTSSAYSTANSTFYIGGSLAIPADFTTTNDFGTYQVANIDVTVTD